MRNVRLISRRLAMMAIALLAASALLATVGAAAAGTFAAHAQRPAYDASALELRGHGGYTTARKHTELRVTVCLQKRLGGRVYPVRCETGVARGQAGDGRSQRARLRAGDLADDRDRRSAEPEGRMGPPGERHQRPLQMLR